MNEYHFQTIKTLKAYTKGYRKKLNKGDIAVIAEDNKRYLWNGKEWQDATPKISLKDLNAALYAQQADHTEEELQEDIEIINNFRDITDGHYYMLLCKERSYYTVLVYNPSNANETIGEAVLACMTNLGAIKEVFNNDNNDIEIWVNDKENNMECYHLFKYDIGVVEFY